MWNPRTCECQCDKQCQSSQYLDHKNCICKIKLIGRVKWLINIKQFS